MIGYSLILLKMVTNIYQEIKTGNYTLILVFRKNEYNGVWIDTTESELYKFNVDFPMIKWSDEQAWKISDLKKLKVVKIIKNYLTFQVTSDILNNVRKILIIQLANTTPYRAVLTTPSTHKKITDIPTPKQAKKSVAMCKGSIPFI